MGLTSFWSDFTKKRVREIPPRNKKDGIDRRPATSSGARAFSFECDGDLNLQESMLTPNLIEPPRRTEVPVEDRKSKRRSRGLSLSREKSERDVSRRRSLFGAKKATATQEDVPQVPTLPPLKDIYSRQLTPTFGTDMRPTTATSSIRHVRPYQVLGLDTDSQKLAPAALGNDSSAVVSPISPAGQVFELPADCPVSGTRPFATIQPQKQKDLPLTPQGDVKKTRRKSIGEVLSRKRAKSSASDMSSVSKRKSFFREKGWTADFDAPPTPALPVTQRSVTETVPTPQTPAQNTLEVRRRRSNASVASKASRNSKRKSWWQSSKTNDDDELLTLPPVPVAMPSKRENAIVGTPSPEKRKSNRLSKRQSSLGVVSTGLPPFAGVPASKLDNNGTASVCMNGGKKHVDNIGSGAETKKKRSQSTSSNTRDKRNSWWQSSNPDDDEKASVMPPVPYLTPDLTPLLSSSDAGTQGLFRSNSHLSDATVSSQTSAISPRMYRPRSAAKGILLSTTNVPGNVRTSVRYSLAADPDSELEDGRGAWCLSARQQREWEKLKHLMAVMDRRQGQAAQGFDRGMFKDSDESEDEDKDGVKYSNRDALAALKVGVAR